MQQIIVIRKLGPYLGEKPINNPDSLLKAVKKVLKDLKEEKPSLEGLSIGELSFLTDENKGISIKFLFN